MGKGRTTTGMILACLIKDILFGDSEKIYFKESDLVNPKDYSDEEEAAEEVILFCLSVCLSPPSPSLINPKDCSDAEVISYSIYISVSLSLNLSFVSLSNTHSLSLPPYFLNSYLLTTSQRGRRGQFSVIFNLIPDG